MRVLRVHASHFGPLLDLDTGEGTPLPALVAVLGPNEAGKSSFHQAVVSLFYGFYPATRDNHPLAPWSGESPELRGWIQTGEEGILEVHRRLLSRPSGSLTRGSRVEDLRNHELDLVAHVDRGVFQQVYALTLADLAGLEGEGWEAVQDRLVVGMGAGDVRSPRDAAEELEQRANGLWRSDRRGRPRHAELRDELGELREVRREALARDRTVRELHRQMEEAMRDRDALREERARLDAKRARIERLLPVATGLREISRLSDQAGPREDLVDLPADPGATLEGFGERLDEVDERIARLEGRKRELDEEVRAPSPSQEKLLARRSEIQALVDRIPILQERAASRGHLEAELDHLERRLQTTAGPLFGGTRLPDADTLASVPFPRLREALQEAQRAENRLGTLREEMESLERRPASPEPGPPPRTSLLAVVAGPLLLLGAFVLAVQADLTAASVALGVLGLASLGWGGWGLARWQAQRETAREAAGSRGREKDALAQRVSEVTREVEEARNRVDGLLASLPPIAGVPEGAGGREGAGISEGAGPTSLGPELARDLEQLRDLLLDKERGNQDLARIVSEDEAVTEALARFGEEIEGLGDLPDDPVSALPELGRRLEAAVELRRRGEEAARELERLHEDLTRARERREDLLARKEALESAIRTAGGEAGSIGEAIRRARERLRALDRLEIARQTLESERPHLVRERDEIREARQAGEAWLDDPEASSRLEARRDALTEEIEQLADRLAEAGAEARRLEEEETVDLVDGRILQVEEELERVALQRDRLFALARLIRVAERRFRDAHQPDLLRRAGVYLERITGGRYRRLLLSEDPERDPFLLEADHLPGPHAVSPPLSTATREQVYLALRLGIVDHLDRGRDALPLFLDEVLVNWDRLRRERGLDLLAEVSEHRQIFLFTCHSGLAEGVEERGGLILRLSGPGAGS